MPPKRYRSKRPMSRKPSNRRRLQPVKSAVASTVKALMPTALKVARAGYTAYKGYKRNQSTWRRNARATSLAVSDNIIKLADTVVGTQKQISFDEKVSRVDRPPILFKRNYEFNAECGSGRKAWFSMEFNIMNANDLNADLTTYKSQQFTDTATADPTASLTSGYDGAKYYVDFLNERLQLVNSCSSSLFGKIHLFAHKRDGAGYAGAPMTPINMMMYYSTFRLPQNVTANEATVGNGWKFDTATASLNWQAVYNMPGSSLNAAGNTALTDPALSTSSPHIADGLNFWFRKVSSQDFNLKPGQQLLKTFRFNDLKDIFREEQSSFTYLAGVTFSCVVEFQGQVAGEFATSNVSSSFVQLSVIRHSTRQIGIRNKLKSKIYLITNPATVIAPANTYIVNADIGDADTGVNYDS